MSPCEWQQAALIAGFLHIHAVFCLVFLTECESHIISLVTKCHCSGSSQRRDFTFWLSSKRQLELWHFHLPLKAQWRPDAFFFFSRDLKYSLLLQKMVMWGAQIQSVTHLMMVNISLKEDLINWINPDYYKRNKSQINLLASAGDDGVFHINKTTGRITLLTLPMYLKREIFNIKVRVSYRAISAFF